MSTQKLKMMVVISHNALHFILFAWDHTFDALEMAKLLVIEKGIDINTTCDWRGDTALHYLFRNYKGGSKTQIAKILIDGGIDVTVKNKGGTCFSYFRNDVSYIFGDKADERAELDKILKENDTCRSLLPLQQQ